MMPITAAAGELALDKLNQPQEREDGGGSEGHEEIRSEHARTIGAGVAQGVSLAG